MAEIVVLEKVTKYYGDKKALDNITVSFEEGKITGFLGLNGAGKTTTMKIITTYFKPNAGKVFVNSINVLEKPYEIRKIIGYLPENFPIYDNLTVIDFLRFAALAKGVEKIDEEIQKVMKLVDIESYKNSFLRELSKGYRQRVGIAQAIIGDPKVIILDEPTQGLDPAQIIEIRKLIKNLAHNRTIILSTHIMQEVEAICDNVVIIHQGSIMASDSITNLKEKTGNILIEYLFNEINEEMKQKIKNILLKYGIKKVEYSSNLCRFEIDKKLEPKIEDINLDFWHAGLIFRYVTRNLLTMEDLFLRIIGQ